MQSRYPRKPSTAQRGTLSLMDLIIIGILLTVLLIAARQDFAGFRGRATPVLETEPPQAAAE